MCERFRDLHITRSCVTFTNVIFFFYDDWLLITLHRVMNKIKIALVIRIPRIEASRDAAINIRFGMIGI